MTMPHRWLVPLSLIWAAVGGAAWAAPTRVLRAPDPSAPLAARWDWSIRQAAGPDFQKGYWVGYSIRRRMSENSFYGTWYSSPRERYQTLAEILSGRPTPVPDARAEAQAVKDAARKAIDHIDGRREPVRIVDKDIAILLRFGPQAGRPPVETEICELKSIFQPENLPVLWLEGASDKDSLALLDRLYSGPAPEKIKLDLIQAVALLQTPGLAVPFLERVVAPATAEPLRREAADALGEQDDPRAVEILKRLAERDLSANVRDDAVSALAESIVPASVDALIALAVKSAFEDVRKEAVDGLAEKASEKSVQALERVAFDDKDTEVQEEAVSALSELPAAEALPVLTKLAKTHPNPEVRKAAISALSELNDPAVITVLVDIIKGRK